MAGFGSLYRNVLILGAGNGGATPATQRPKLSASGGTERGLNVTSGAGTAVAAGGDIAITAGNGAVATAGGAVAITAGSGGATGTAGGITITGGAGGSTSGNAGGVTLSGGTPVDGNGGAIALSGTNGVGSARNGGNVNATAGNATDGGTGGAINITAGSGGASGTPGTVTITAGAGGSASGPGGLVRIVGGSGVAGNGAGGNVDLAPGAAHGTGIAGEVRVNNSTAGFLPVCFVYTAGSATGTEVSFFVASRAYRVKSIIGRVDTQQAGTNAVIRKAPSATAISGGTALHTGNFDLNGTDNSNQVLSLSAAPADLEIPAGTAIGWNGSAAVVAGIGSVTVTLAPV